jgi:hypothetical protein
VVVTHPDMGERREFVEVRFGVVTDVSIVRRENTDRTKDYPLPNLGQPSAPIRETRRPEGLRLPIDGRGTNRG